MNRKIGIIGTLLALMTLMAVFAVVPAWAADPVNATTTTESNTSYSGASSAGSAVAKGGNITEVTVTVASQTSKWQGYYGDVSGGVQLAGSGGTTIMYSWTSDPVGEVYATQDSDVNATEWDALTNQSGAFIDANFTGFTASDADSATNTFVNTSSEIIVGSTTIDAGKVKSAVKTRASNGTATWETIALGPTTASSESDFVFAAIIRGSSSNDAYDGTTKDFQMIVPVQDTPAPYYFYVELT